MTLGNFADRDRVERFGSQLYLLWAGLSIGVAFLATPAKFLAPSLTLPVALDVGQHTFRVYNGAELMLLGVVLVMGIWSRSRKRWYLAALLPTVVVLLQTLWLIPALDLRVMAIHAGQSPLPPSNLHTAYVGAEVVKVLWLLCQGFALAPLSAIGAARSWRLRSCRPLQDRR